MNEQEWVVKGGSAQEHLDKLERELDKKVVDDPMLRDHIRRLKFAWRKGRRFMPQAA
jgi:CHASE3 domain sensor protein